ncbi:MAG: hypothetical protein NVV72_02740 [Asticcacaulis sp.]|nr:hypothetical protein [Asticcacaulis sp.]
MSPKKTSPDFPTTLSVSNSIIKRYRRIYAAMKNSGASFSKLIIIAATVFMAAVRRSPFPGMVFPLRSGFGTLAVTPSLKTVNYGKSPMHIFMCDLQLCNNTDVRNTVTAINCNIIELIDATITHGFWLFSHSSDSPDL